MQMCLKIYTGFNRDTRCANPESIHRHSRTSSRKVSSRQPGLVQLFVAKLPEMRIDGQEHQRR
jgi:hypothetical protein